MTGRERYLAVLNNEKPDRLPCQVHSWMEYYLKTYLNGADQYQAYEAFGMDPVIYTAPKFIYSQKDMSNWSENYFDLGKTDAGDHLWQKIISTPKVFVTAA